MKGPLVAQYVPQVINLLPKNLSTEFSCLIISLYFLSYIFSATKQSQNKLPAKHKVNRK